MSKNICNPIVPMESAQSLDVNGAFVFSMHLPAQDFVKDLRECANNWFHTNLKLMLDEPLPVMFHSAEEPFTPKPDLIASAQEWNTLTEEAKASYRWTIDLRTDHGMSMAFDLDYLDKELKKERLSSMPGKKYFRQAIIFTKQGNAGMPLGSLATAWTKGGFGKWAHICPDIGLPMVVEAMKMMERLGLKPGLPNHFPHPIYKPPSGSALSIHHDQMNPSDLVRNLRNHVKSNDPSMSTWVSKYGVQMLAHLQGGTGVGNGATFIVGPMTPTKMLICLETFAKVSRDGDFERWYAKVDNIHFLDVDKYLLDFNDALKHAGLDPIGRVPIVPTDLQAFADGFGLGFPVGMWHGSFPNTGKGNRASSIRSRITITMPLTLGDSVQSSDPRIRDRLQAMAVISRDGLPEGDYEAAGAWLANDLMPYADGGTHRHPEKVLDFICCSSAATVLGRPVGPYCNISVKQDTVTHYLAVLAAVERGDSLLGPTILSASTMPPATLEHSDSDDPVEDMVLADLVPLVSDASVMRTPPSPNVLLQYDVRLLKVKQPWAEALVTGQKNVENRTWKLTPSTGFPTWVIVVSSKSIPTRKHMEDYTARLTVQAGPGATGPGGPTLRKHEFVLGKIVGMIHVIGCYSEDQMPNTSVWYNNSPDMGWVVDDAWEFQEPIELDVDDKFQTQVSLREREQYLPRLVEEINKLEPTY